MTRWLTDATLALLAVLTGVSGGGYSLHGTCRRTSKRSACRSSSTGRPAPAVESIVTRALVQAFSTNGRLRVVNPAEADAILEGEVVSYSVSPIAFDAQGNIRTFRFVVSLSLILRDVRRNTVLFQQAVSERADFQVLGRGANVVSQTISQEEAALRGAAVDIRRTIVRLVVELL